MLLYYKGKPLTFVPPVTVRLALNISKVKVLTRFTHIFIESWPTSPRMCNIQFEFPLRNTETNCMCSRNNGLKSLHTYEVKHLLHAFVMLLCFLYLYYH